MTNANDTASVAATYAQRGWAVIPIRAGAKMPIERDWPNQGRRTAAEVRAAWELYPDANVGIVTGRVSGLWVLDIDPQNGGTLALAGLVQAYGKLPETYVVRTPSGGLHYYFLLPEDFEPRNAQHGRVAGRLPVGIDVRGRGGQVVAPPSVRPDGAYVLINDFPLSPAPEWLLDMIRPIEPPERVEAPTVLDDLRVGRFWDGWIRKVFTDELQRLAGAPEGSRDEIAFGVALRLVEICNSSWNDLEPDEVFPHFMRACQIASDNGAVPFTAGEEKWRNALRRKAGAGVPPPAPLGITGSVMPTDFDQAGQAPANPFVSPGTIQASTGVAGESINGPVEQGEVLDPFEIEVRKAVGWLMVRDEAARRMRSAVSAKSPIQIMDREAQQKMPRMQPLIAGWLGRGQAARIYGPPGAGKSFVAVEMAACIAQGVAWHGRSVAQGEVVYFAVEDAEGIALRLRAWEMHHQVQHRVNMVSTPIQMNVETVHRVLAAIEAYFDQREVVLIVLDTQAMVTVGMDENSVADMGVFVEAIKLLATKTGATVLTVHHSGVRGGRARGSTSVLGAMDVELEASMTGAMVTLSAVKQKNVTKPTPIMAGLNVVDIGERDAFGAAITSCVLIAPEDATGPFTSPVGPGLSQLQKRAMAIATVLMETDATGETYARVRTRAAEVTDFGKTTATITSSFSRAWAYLVRQGRVAKASGREAFYFIDIEGLDRLAMNPDKAVIGAPEVYLG